MKAQTIRRNALGAVAAIAITLTAACANPSDTAKVEGADSGKDNSASITMEQDEKLSRMVPENYRDSGEFAVAVNPSSPPLKYLDNNGEFTGLAPDLINAAADVLGLNAKMEQASFDALLPGLEAKRFDVILSINDFKERRDQIDFIDYLWAGTAITGSSKLEQDSVTPDSLCGLSVGYARGNAQQGLLDKAAGQCKKEQSDDVESVGFQDINAALLAVSSGQVDAVWGDATSMVYSAEEEPDVYKVLYEERSGPYGVGVHKEDAEFRDALQAALQKCVEDGLYDELLSKYGMDDYALTEMPLNEGPANDE